MRLGTQRVLRHLGPPSGQDVRWIGGSDDRTDVVRIGDTVCKVFLFDGGEPDREVAALELLERSAVPAPRLLDAGTFPEGERWLLMTAAPGMPFPLEPPGWDGPRGIAFQELRGGLAGRLHTAVRPPRFGAWTRDPRSSLADLALERSEILFERAVRARPASAASTGALRRRQVELQPALDGTDRPVLVHGDLGPGNVLVVGGDERPVVTAIVDWECSEASDPTAELAWVFLYGFDTPGVQAFCRAYLDVTHSPLDPRRAGYFLIDAVFRALATQGGRWTAELRAHTRATTERLLAGDLPDPTA